MTVARSSGPPPGEVPRGGDAATDRLPFVDEHGQRIDAPVDRVWAALSEVRVLLQVLG